MSATQNAMRENFRNTSYKWKTTASSHLGTYKIRCEDYTRIYPYIGNMKLANLESAVEKSAIRV